MSTYSKMPVPSSVTRFREVDEVWDKMKYQYTIIEQAVPSSVNGADEDYYFVARRRLDRVTKVTTLFIDIKCPALQQMLSAVLQNVRGISVQEDHPTVEGNVLFHFLPDLKAYRDEVTDGMPNDQYSLLLNFIECAYASKLKRLKSLLEKREITFDLLPMIFKPNGDIYTTCAGSEQPMCVRFNYGEAKTPTDRPECYSLNVRSFQYNGKLFGEATSVIEIKKFRGAKRIDSLIAYPIQFLRDPAAMRSRLIENGRAFLDLIGIHHKQYQGIAFRRDEKLGIVKVPVESRIIIDAELFLLMNPAYRTSTIVDMILGEVRLERDEAELITDGCWVIEELTAEELIICSPTVRGFSLDDKQWLEFAVTDVKEIRWSESLLSSLTLPVTRKNVIGALCNAHSARRRDLKRDAFVIGKGRGMAILLHGPPGVGKTMTAEAMSEHLNRPLYSISVGELGTDTHMLESRLTGIFAMADRWDALLLLDEADVYVEARSQLFCQNELVCVFLRKLEYYPGIFILTTNRATAIDEAIISRIHLALSYHPLSKAARKAVWREHLHKITNANGGAKIKDDDLEDLAEKVLNGREIKNAVITANALAMQEHKVLSKKHTEEALKLNEEFQRDFRGAGQIENLQAYQ